MSDQGDKTCPLCAEEMDLTDQQLKPCKCGYEICVWCWHHIMDMAEKDNTEGRCPACRTPYNKAKIVGTAAKCDKAEMSAEKRSSSRKGKVKTADSRKQLSEVRVVQRNLVYVMGLPLSLADEDLLQRKDYFAMYGKVLKVSISRTAAGAIQNFANNTCSVYITYSKEEEAILCIQSVHGFILDDKPLRACFGTTKYCHAWLRNVPCINPDCVYLHEIGSQEDSFTKDEVISAYTRSRVQQITGAVNSMHRRSGSMLPPPAEEYCNNSSASAGKPISKNPAANSTASVKISPPNSSSGRSAALPPGALWGTRTSNNQQPPASVPCSNGPLSKKPVTCNPSAFSTSGGSTSHVSLLPAKVVHTEESGTTQNKGKKETYTSDNPSIPVPSASSSMNTQLHCSLSLEDKDKRTIMTSTTNALDIPVMSNGPGFAKGSNDPADVKIQNLTSDISSLSIDKHKNSRAPLSSEADEICISREKSDLRLDAWNEMEDDLLSFNEQRHRDPEVIIEKAYSPGLSLSMRPPAQPSVGSNFGSSNNGYMENVSNCMPMPDLQTINGSYYPLSNEGNITDNNVVGESSIISNILSMDFDPWNESLNSPQNLAKLLGETDNQQGSFRASSSRKVNSNQSRFSFAREEPMMNQSYIDHSYNHYPHGHDFPNSRSYQPDNFVTRNGFSRANNEEPMGFGNSFSHLSSNKLSVSRPQMSAPPGFSAPNRAAPPGFTSHYERMEQNFDSLHGNHLLGTSSLHNQYLAPPVGNASNGDIEFMDPAILAVGKGVPNGLGISSLDTSSSFPPQLSSFENEGRLQLLMQRPLTTHQNQGFSDMAGNQNQRFSDMAGNFSPFGDAYGISQAPFSQLSVPQSRNSVISNGLWDGWNGVRNGNNLGEAELLRSDNMGFNKFFNGYEEPKYNMPHSGNLYNRTFGM